MTHAGQSAITDACALPMLRNTYSMGAFCLLVQAYIYYVLKT